MNKRLARSIAICPQPGCGGDSQVEDTAKKDTWYVRRLRGCVKCGHTWSTAEIPLPMIRRTVQLDNFIKAMRQ